MLLPRKWSWRIHDHGLHIQAALYIDIVEAVTGTRPVWGGLVHQSAEPYATRLFQCSEEDIEDGREAIAVALNRWRTYLETGDCWAGWPTERETVARPRSVKEAA